MEVTVVFWILFIIEFSHGQKTCKGADETCSTKEECCSGVCRILTQFDSYATCSKPSPEKGYTGGLGSCNDDSECFSGYCYAHEIAWGYHCAADSPIRGKVADKSACWIRFGNHTTADEWDYRCFSGVCYDLSDSGMGSCLKIGGTDCEEEYPEYCASSVCDDQHKCAPKGPTRLTVADYGFCRNSSNCHSNMCIQNVCVVRGGTRCIRSKDCFSGYCYNNLCAADSPEAGKVGNGGPCKETTQCYSGHCEANLCVRVSP